MTTLPSLNEFLDHSVANGGSFLLLQLQSKWPSGSGIDHKNVGSVWPCIEDQKLGEKLQSTLCYSMQKLKRNKTHYFYHFSVLPFFSWGIVFVLLVKSKRLELKGCGLRHLIRNSK